MDSLLAELNAQLSQHTFVSSLEFTSDLSTGNCDILIRLANDTIRPTSILTLELEQVFGVMLSRFGGGVTQIIGLYLRDIRSDQHDGVNYELVDLEDSKLGVKCRNFTSRMETVPQKENDFR